MKIGDLILEKCIGKGETGEIFLTSKIEDSTKKYATKRIKKLPDPEKQSYIKKENEILNLLNNDKIIKMFEIRENNNFYFIVKEYCNGGSLKDCSDKYQEKYEKPFSLEIIQYIMKQIVECLTYIHSLNIIHRDLKLKNILVVFESEEDKKKLNMMNAKIKLNDFGYATKNSRELHKTIIGSSYNADPFILSLLNDKNNAGYDEKADIWALGTVCYQMLTGKSLFNVNNAKELIKNYQKGIYTLPFNANKEIVDFIGSMLKFNCEERLSAEELLKHPFLVKDIKDFEKINFNKIKEKIGKNGFNSNFLTNSLLFQINENLSNISD